MTLEIQDDCDTAFGCLKGVVVTIYSLMVIFIIIRILYKMHTYTNKILSFEIIPLSSTIIQSLLQLILNVFIMDTKLIISALYSQTLTFGIISTSCSQLCLRIKYPHRQRTAKRYTIFAFIFAQSTSLIMYILTLTDVVPLDCNDWFSVAYLFPMGVMLVYTVFSIFYGSSLLNILKTKDDEVMKQESHTSGKGINQTDSGNGATPGQNNEVVSNGMHHTSSVPSIKMRTISYMNNSMQVDKEGAFFTQLKRQLQLIECLFLATIIIQISMDAVRTYALSDIIQCIGSNEVRSSEFQAQTEWGQVFLTFYQILQITPCLIAPYVFYYVPFKAKKIGGSILFSEQFLSIAMPNEQDNEDENLDDSLNSRLIMSDNFDFSREEKFNPNDKKKKSKKKTDQAGEKGDKSKSKVDFENILPENLKDSSPRSPKYFDNNNSNNKSQYSNLSNGNGQSNLSNNVKNNGRSGNKISKNSNQESYYGLQRKNTLEDMDEYIDRMSLRREDVDRSRKDTMNNQSMEFKMNEQGGENEGLQFKKGKAKNENNNSINSSSSQSQSEVKESQNDTTFNRNLVKNEITDQYRATNDQTLDKK